MHISKTLFSAQPRWLSSPVSHAGITESLRLGETSKITKSNLQPDITMPTNTLVSGRRVYLLNQLYMPCIYSLGNSLSKANLYLLFSGQEKSLIFGGSREKEKHFVHVAIKNPNKALTGSKWYICSNLDLTATLLYELSFKNEKKPMKPPQKTHPILILHEISTKTICIQSEHLLRISTENS